jgi:hypothetical protein
VESKVREDSDCLRDMWREEPCTPYRSGFCVGGVSVGLTGPREQDVVLGPQLQPFHLASAPYDIDIHIEWVKGLPKMPGRKLFDSGAAWRLYEGSGDLQFDFGYPVPGKPPHKRLFVDSDFCRATLQLSEESFADIPITPDPMEYPLDELLIMHRLTQEKGIELHGCGIVRGDGVGNLFVGHSGAGKSTTTRLWTEREDVEVLSDDRIIVRRDGGGSAVKTPSGAGGGANEQQVLRLRDSSASRTSHFAQDDKTKKTWGMRMYGTPWHGEAMYASPGSAPLARIFVLEHGRGNVVTRLSPSQAVGELFARSFVPFHRHEYVESALEFLQELVGAVPVYHYAFEPTEVAVERILEFCD